jgi:hypothetical protein
LSFIANEETLVPLFWLPATFIVNPQVVAGYVTRGLPSPPRDMEYIKAAQ